MPLKNNVLQLMFSVSRKFFRPDEIRRRSNVFWRNIFRSEIYTSCTKIVCDE